MEGIFFDPIKYIYNVLINAKITETIIYSVHINAEISESIKAKGCKGVLGSQVFKVMPK